MTDNINEDGLKIDIQIARVKTAIECSEEVIEYLNRNTGESVPGRKQNIESIAIENENQIEYKKLIEKLELKRSKIYN